MKEIFRLLIVCLFLYIILFFYINEIKKMSKNRLTASVQNENEIETMIAKIPYRTAWEIPETVSYKDVKSGKVR